MSDIPELDDAAFKLATGEELLLPGDAPSTASTSPLPQSGVPALAPVGPRPVARPSLRDRRTAGRLRARKVRRLVRHVEPWSVLKVALIFYFCLWVILLIAGVMLWSLAVSSGTVDNIETFITELFALESFTFNADQIFRASAIGGLVLVVAGAGRAVGRSVRQLPLQVVAHAALHVVQQFLALTNDLLDGRAGLVASQPDVDHKLLLLHARVENLQPCQRRKQDLLLSRVLRDGREVGTPDARSFAVEH